MACSMICSHHSSGLAHGLDTRSLRDHARDIDRSAPATFFRPNLLCDTSHMAAPGLSRAIRYPDATRRGAHP
jgi:hypothetical protein